MWLNRKPVSWPEVSHKTCKFFYQNNFFGSRYLPLLPSRKAASLTFSCGSVRFHVILMSAPQTICLKRLAANRANAQLSTGPRTEEGKAASSLNAVRTGLTGRTVLLPSEDADAYEAHLAQYRDEFQPVGVRETQLVQNLADTQWRLDRIPSLENGIFALGRLRYADLFPDQKAMHLLDAHILMTDAKHFKNLHLQESRLRRQYRQDAQELAERQAKRKEEQKEAEEQTRLRQKTTAQAATPNGFEFTNSEQPGQAQEMSGKPNGSARTCTGSV